MDIKKTDAEKSGINLIIDKPADILPHGSGFLFVDEIKELNKGKSIIAVRRVSEDDFWVPHHFPSNPVMPGALIIEAMAQTAALLVLVSYPEFRGVPFFLAGIKEARFRKPVIPPAELILKAYFEGRKVNIWMFSCHAFLEDQEVASAKIIASSQEKKK